MTRIEKLKRIERYRPHLYLKIKREIPTLIVEPNSATDKEINLYNEMISDEARRDHNNITFKKNFSF